MKSYVGAIAADGTRQVHVVAADGRQNPLLPPCQMFPEPLSDYDWGRWNRDAQKLAYAILTDAVDEGTAVSQHLLYALEVIAKLPADQPWSLTQLDVETWVNQP